MITDDPHATMEPLFLPCRAHMPTQHSPDLHGNPRAKTNVQADPAKTHNKDSGCAQAHADDEVLFAGEVISGACVAASGRLLITSAVGPCPHTCRSGTYLTYAALPNRRPWPSLGIVLK